MTTSPRSHAISPGRRAVMGGVIVGLFSALLAACGPRTARLDTGSTATRLTEAVEAVPGFTGGGIVVQDSMQTGSSIRGKLLVSATDRAGVAETFHACAVALLEAWEGMDVDRSFTVRVEARSEADQKIVVNTAELLGRDRLDTITVEELQQGL